MFVSQAQGIRNPVARRVMSGSVLGTAKKDIIFSD